MYDQLVQIISESPGLKAKAIARKLGFLRSDVNAILHKHTEQFVQDNDYGWHMSSNAYLIVEFQPRWIDATSFEHSLSSVGSPLDRDFKEIRFVIPSECKLLLEAAVRLLALCNQLSSEGKKVVVDFSDCRTALSYFDRIGVFEHLADVVSVVPSRPRVSRARTFRGNNSAIVEFGSVSIGTGSKDLVNRLSSIFVQQSDIRYEVAASTFFGELIGNINDHSESTAPGFAALQKYSGRKTHIQTVVSDSGCGIPATLRPIIRRNYPHLENVSDIELVKAVLMSGEISRHGPGGGLGFKSSREQTIKFDAQLSVRQTDFSFTVEYKNGIVVNMREENELARINGTHVCFDFFVD